MLIVAVQSKPWPGPNAMTRAGAIVTAGVPGGQLATGPAGQPVLLSWAFAASWACSFAFSFSSGLTRAELCAASGSACT